MDSITSENITNEFLAFNQSQWTSNGSNIYLNSSVGIGTSFPRANLDVYGTINALSANFGTVYTGGTVFSSLNVVGIANIYGNLTVSNLIVTGNFVNVVSNTQFSNAVTINNAGTSTALKVHQLESVPVHTNNVAEFWDYQTLALLINGDGNVGIHTTLINPHAFAVVGSSNLDYIKTINVYSSNAVAASNLYGNVVGSNTVSASKLYGPIIGSNTVSASGLYGPVVGANTITGTTISGSTLYGPLAGSNTVVGSTIYGPIAGSNTISASTIYGQLAGSNTIAGSSLTLGTALSIGNGGTGQTTKSAAFDSLSPMTTAGDLIYGGVSGTGTRLATGTTTQILHGGTTPSWSAVSLTADVSGTLPVGNGGTGLTSTSANFVFAGPTTGAAAAPTWRALVSADIPNNAAAAGSLSTNFTSGYVLYGQGTGVPAYASGHFWDNTNSRLGLGTASPTSPLHIISSQTSTGNMVIIDGSGQTTVDTGIRINSGAGKNPYIDWVQNGTAKGNMYWDNANSRMVHNGQSTDNYFAGNVGIGITPGYTLDVSGTAHCSGILYVGNNSTATAVGSEGGKIYLGGTYGDSAFDHNVIVSRLYAANESSEMVLFKGNDPAAAGPDRIRLRAASICFDTYPAATTDYSAENIRWTVDNSGNFIRSGASATTYTGICMGASGAGITWLDRASCIIDDGDLRVCTDDTMHFQCGSSASGYGTELMKIVGGTGTIAGGTSGKGVGFSHAGIFIDRTWSDNPSITVCNTSGTGSAVAQQTTLRIHGTNATFASYPASGGADFSVNVVADGTFTGGSDRRSKSNITSITKAVDLVSKMDGKRFQRINRNGDIQEHLSENGYKFGFLAQDLKQNGIEELYNYYPEADDGTENYNLAYAVDYGSVTAILVNAIKEQQLMIKSLQDRLAAAGL